MKTEDNGFWPFAVAAGDVCIADAAWADDVEYGRICIPYGKVNRRIITGFDDISWRIVA